MSWTSRAGRAALALLPAVGLALWAASAQAQSLPGMSGLGSRGGGLLGRSVTVELTERAEYDSDVARGNDTLATVRGVRKDDILYSPSVNVAAALPIGRQAFFLDGRFGYDFYQYNKVLQREDIQVQSGFSGRLGPCTAGLVGQWSRRQSDLADLVAAVTRNTQQATSGGIQIGCSEGAGLGEEVAYQHADTTNSADRGVVDSESNTVTVGVNYSNRLLGAVGVSGVYSRVNYSNSSLPAAGLPPLTATGFKTYSANLTYSRPIGTRIEGSMQLGYSHVRSEGPIPQEFSGLTGRAQLSYKVSSRLQTSIAYDRSAQPTIQQGSAYAIQEAVSVDARYTMSSRLTTSLGAHWGKRSYRGEVIVTPNLILNDEVRAVYGSVRMSIGRHAAVTVDARQETRNTNLTLFNYSAYRVGVTATQTF